jgi:hypothetical protein
MRKTLIGGLTATVAAVGIAVAAPAHAEPDYPHSDDGHPLSEDEVQMAACLYISPMYKLSPSQAEGLLASKTHISDSKAHAEVLSAIASGCAVGS